MFIASLGIRTFESRETTGTKAPAANKGEQVFNNDYNIMTGSSFLYHIQGRVAYGKFETLQDVTRLLFSVSQWCSNSLAIEIEFKGRRPCKI